MTTKIDYTWPELILLIQDGKLETFYYVWAYTAYTDHQKRKKHMSVQKNMHIIEQINSSDRIKIIGDWYFYTESNIGLLYKEACMTDWFKHFDQNDKLFINFWHAYAWWKKPCL